MLFEEEKDVLDWYERQERVLTKDFLATIPWQDVGKTELDQAFIPVLLYMRDTEKFTEIYYHDLRKTPTGKDPIIKRFMDRWSAEEALHADLLNRFLAESNHPTTDDWYERAKAAIPTSYKMTAPFMHYLTNCFGRDFSAVHMTWGSINELSTLSGYERLWQLAKHPVLEYLLRAIAREETRHSFFYWAVARIKLKKSRFRERLARFIIKHFWIPVGQGTRPASDTNYVIRTLFSGVEGIDFMDKQVSRRVRELPGFAGFTTVTERVARAAEL